jgi:general secretion pathway protein N
MGSYRVQLRGGADQAPPQIELSTLSGSLQLSGQGQWLDHRLRFQGEATAAAQHEAALSNLLNIIGRRQGSRSLLSLG